MSKKLLAHFERMQDQMRAYVEPGDPNKPVNQHRIDSDFINNMIYMLDGPEQREAQAHASFNYEAECLRTASNQFHGDLVPMRELRRRLHNFIQAADELDYVKKLLFYGEDAAKGRFAINGLNETDCNAAIDLIVDFDEDGPWINREDAMLLLHGVIGGATEKGELAEALAKAIDGEPLDLVNVREEVFDGQWYDALICAAGGFTFDEGQRNNIAKLRKRFPEKFTEEAANVRDLAAERAVLEGKQAAADNGYTEITTYEGRLGEIRTGKLERTLEFDTERGHAKIDIGEPTKPRDAFPGVVVKISGPPGSGKTRVRGRIQALLEAGAFIDMPHISLRETQEPPAAIPSTIKLGDLEGVGMYLYGQAEPVAWLMSDNSIHWADAERAAATQAPMYERPSHVGNAFNICGACGYRDGFHAEKCPNK